MATPAARIIDPPTTKATFTPYGTGGNPDTALFAVQAGQNREDAFVIANLLLKGALDVVTDTPQDGLRSETAYIVAFAMSGALAIHTAAGVAP